MTLRARLALSAALAVAAALIAASWVLLIVQFDQFRARLPEFHQFFGWRNLVYLWATMGVAKVIHVDAPHFASPTAENLAEMRRLLATAGENLGNDDTLNAVNMQFHREIAIASGNTVLTQLLGVLSELFRDELVVSVDAVKSTLRALFSAFGLEALPHGLYRVGIEHQRQVTAHAPSGPGKNFIRVLVGDRVRVALMPADRTRGRVVEKL